MTDLEPRLALTFDDVSIVPGLSEVHPNDVDLRTRVCRGISLNIPILSAAMDTVTESRLAIALAQEGGIGIVHKNLPIEVQAEEVDKVKRSEAGMIVDPVTMRPDQSIREALVVMARYKISGVPVTERRGAPGRHPHQPRPALRGQPGQADRRADDQGGPGHGARGNHARAGQGPAPQAPHREGSGRRPGGQPQGADHGQGHPEDDRSTRTPARTSWGGCGSARRWAPRGDFLERAAALVERQGGPARPRLLARPQPGRARRRWQAARALPRDPARRRQRRHRRGRRSP